MPNFKKGQFQQTFYCAMHTVLARYCYRKSSVRLSVCPSVRLSVTLRYRHEHIGFTSSKLITPVFAQGLHSTVIQHRQSSVRGTPLKFGWNSGGVVLSRKPAISLKRGKIWPRLHWWPIGSRICIRAFDLCPNKRPRMTLKGHYVLCFKTHACFGAYHENSII